MARTPSITVGIDKRGIRAIERRLGMLPREMARVAQSAANATSIDARKRAKAVIPRVFDEPTDETRDAFFAQVKRLGSVSDLRDVSAGIGIKSPQDRWLKYHLGDDDQTRYPGVIGPADEHIMIPIEENLSSPEARAAGVPGNLTPGGNMLQQLSTQFRPYRVISADPESIGNRARSEHEASSLI